MENCNLCGKCNLFNTTYRVFKRETISPRVKAALAKQKKASKIFFTDILDGSVKISCPAKIDLDQAILDMRDFTIKEGKAPDFCKEILKNFEEHSNPVGEIKKHKTYKAYFG